MNCADCEVRAKEADAWEARRLELLRDLAEVGADLARAVAIATKNRLAMLAEGWTSPALSGDPAAHFAKLTQAVRRTIALEDWLRARQAARPPLFRTPDELAPDPTPTQRPLRVEGVAVGRPTSEWPQLAVVRERSPRDQLRADLGSLLDPPEPFPDFSAESTGDALVRLMGVLGLSDADLVWRETAWILRADPNDPDSRDLPLRQWRPKAPDTGSGPPPDAGAAQGSRIALAPP